MQERQLFQGSIQALGVFLLVEGIYVQSLGFLDSLVYQGDRYPDWLSPTVYILTGVLLLLGSSVITSFAYGSSCSQWSLASIVPMGIKLLGLWLIYRELIILANLADHWRMNLLPETAPPIDIPYWGVQMVVALAILAAGLFLLRCRPKGETNRGGF